MRPFRANFRGALLVALALSGCSRNLDLPSPKPPTIPAVSITSILPSTLRSGAVANITFMGSAASTSCSATVGGQLASCTFMPPSSCSCTFTVGATLSEGLLPVYAIMGNAVGNGLGLGFVFLDTTPPVVDASSLTITRGPCGGADAVAGAEGAASDGGAPYAERHVATVRIWAAPAGGEPLLSLSPAADGSFAQVDVPATDGAASPAPATYHASAVDAAGNESARVPLPSGALTSPPTIDAFLSVIVDRSSAASGVMGEAGAIGPVATLCGARPVALDGTPIGPALSVAGDGSFPEVTLTAGGPGTVYLRAWDKAGNVAGPTKVRTVDAVTAPGGRAAYSPDLGAALFARAADTSPATVPPAQGPLLAGEVADADADKAAAVDPASFVVSATSETSSVAAQWITSTSQPSGSGYAAYDPRPGREVTVFLAPNGTFENDGTSWTRVADLPFSSPTPVVYHAASGGVVTMTFGPSSAMRKWNGTAWSVVSPAAKPMTYGQIATDTGRNKIVYYDGTTTTWEFDATNWTSIHTGPTSPLVGAPVLAYHDGTTNPGLILYGGYAGGFKTETWRWTPPQWTKITTTTNNPGWCSSGAAAAYHAALGRLVLLGGGSQTGTGYCGDHRPGWLFDGSDWVQVAGTVAPPAGSRAVAYDAARGKLVSANVDTWVYGSSWQEQPPRLPSVRGAKFAWDPRRSAMTYVDVARRTWTVGAAGWTPVGSGAPQDVRSVLYDPERGGLVAFERTLADTWRAWRFDGESWNEDPSTSSGLPAQDDDLAFVADPVRGLIVAVGTGAYEYDGSSWTPRGTTGFYDQYVWLGPLVFFDPARGRVVASGGAWDDGESGGEIRNVWEWTGSAWNLRAGDNAYNSLETATFDANVAQGRTISTDALGASVQFDGTRWTSLAGVSGAAVNAGVAYDPVRRMTVGLSYSREPTEFRYRQPHARHAAVEALFRLPATAIVSTATARLVGAGRGANGAASTYGVQLLAWNWTTWAWTPLGTNGAAETDTAAARTISAALAPANHVRGGRVWLLAVPSYPSSSSFQSQLWIDAVDVAARYTLPP